MQKNIDYIFSKGPMMLLDNLSKVQNKVARILDETVNVGMRMCSTGARLIPPADFYEKDGKYIINVDLPGINIKDIQITCHVDKIIISGDRTAPEEAQPEEAYINKELSYGGFERVFCLPSEVDESKVKAVYKDGVLSITVPVTESKVKKIKIEVEHHKSHEVK